MGAELVAHCAFCMLLLLLFVAKSYEIYYLLDRQKERSRLAERGVVRFEFVRVLVSEILKLSECPLFPDISNL